MESVVAKIVAELPPLDSEQIAAIGRLAAILDDRIEADHANRIATTPSYLLPRLPRSTTLIMTGARGAARGSRPVVII